MGKRKLCWAGDLCFRSCRKPSEDCLPSPGHTAILSLDFPRSSLCSCSTCKSETKVGQTFCSHTPAASSDSKAKLHIFAISADLCNTVYNKRDLKRPDHRLQHILQEWRSRGKEKCIVKAFRVLLIGQSKVFLSHRQSFQSHNAVCIWPQKVRHPRQASMHTTCITRCLQRNPFFWQLELDSFQHACFLVILRAQQPVTGFHSDKT